MTEKQENLLDISMQITEEERKKSPDLDAGYLEDGRYVEIIVRYIGNLGEVLDKYEDVSWEELLNNYGVIVAPIEYVENIIAEEQILYAEKPKMLYFDMVSGKRASCITPLQVESSPVQELFGEGTIVAVIDTGINPYLTDFRDGEGRTRITNIWDQGRDVEITRAEIDEYIEEFQSSGISGGAGEIPGFDTVGHGTQVAQIACGSRGVASKSDIIVVKMGVSGIAGVYTFPRTTQLMRAVDYCVRKGIEYGRPIAINISFGNNYGDHSGNTLLETYLDSVAGVGVGVICVGSGNEGGAAIHTSGRLIDSDELDVELVVSQGESSVDIQIWKEYVDDFAVEIITPGGVNIGRISGYNKVNKTMVQGTEILTYYGEPSPYNMRQEIYINLIPVENYIQAGVWTVRLVPVSIVYGDFDMWLPAAGALNEGTGFARPDENVTITIPATARNVISVGAYDATSGIYATFSGVGYVLETGPYNMVKPEILAPGVDIRIDDSTVVTGTSFATPFVTGAAALLMEWGIVRGNDEFLYGEKLKAYLIRGARPLIEQERPSERSGWGTLCVAKSLLINS